MAQNKAMSQLLIEEVEPDLLAKLASRADRHGRSVPEEHLAILQEALGSEPQTGGSAGEWLKSARGAVKLDAGETVDDVRMDYCVTKFGISG